MDKKRFGLAIRHKRVQQKTSQEELAHLCGLHRTYIGSVERGERNISIDNMIKIAHALRCKVSTLIIAAENMDEF